MEILKLLRELSINTTSVTTEANPCTERIYITLSTPAEAAKVGRNLGAIKSALGIENISFTEIIQGRPLTCSLEYNRASEIVELAPLLRLTPPPGALPVVLGVDSYNKPLWFDLSKAPHVLISGATGQGKSVCIHTMMQSLLQRDDIGFVMVDPKNSELAEYRTRTGCFPEWEEYCQSKRVNVRDAFGSTPREALQLLTFIEELIKARNDKFADVSAVNIEQYNNNVTSNKLPRIVFVCDEFGDLSTNREVETRMRLNPVFMAGGWGVKTQKISFRIGERFPQPD